MARIRSFKAHHHWEDWAGMLLGLAVALSPWLSGQMETQTIMVNAVFSGAVAFLLAELEFADLHRWEELAEVALGAWLAGSPFTFGYSAAGPLRFWHFILGAAIIVLAVLELWQDWSLRSDELAKHGE